MRNKLRIALVAPPFGSTGGPETVVQNLVEALLEKGADVTLFAPADWKTPAKHIPTLEKSLWNMKDFKRQSIRVRSNLIVLSQMKVINFQNDFDIIHLHSQRYAFVVAKLSKKPCVLSFHNKITLPEFKQTEKAGMHTVSLSKSQRGGLRTKAMIWNGVPTKKIRYSFERGTYLMTIGRLTDQKGTDTAIKIAKRTGKKLLIFGRKGDSVMRQEYFNQRIKPFLSEKIVYMGEVSHQKIYDFLRSAEALLFTIRRPEVCPLAVIEALACGTPVIGTKVNPLPEMLKNKKTAYLSNSVSALVSAVKNIDKLSRTECRKYAEKYFDSSVMADKYIKLYEKILKK